MNALASYTRHVITGFLLMLAQKLNLSDDGLSPAVEYIADAAIIFLCWIVVKYAGPFFKKVGILNGAMLFMSLSFFITATSCSVQIDPESGAKHVIIDGPTIIRILDDK